MGCNEHLKHLMLYVHMHHRRHMLKNHVFYLNIQSFVWRKITMKGFVIWNFNKKIVVELDLVVATVPQMNFLQRKITLKESWCMDFWERLIHACTIHHKT